MKSLECIRCPYCNVLVKVRRAELHVSKVHSGGPLDWNAISVLMPCKKCGTHIPTKEIRTHQKSCIRRPTFAKITVFKDSFKDVYAGELSVSVKPFLKGRKKSPVKRMKIIQVSTHQSLPTLGSKYQICMICKSVIKKAQFENHVSQCKSILQPSAIQPVLASSGMEILTCGICGAKVHARNLGRHSAKVHSSKIYDSIQGVPSSKARCKNKSFKPRVIFNTPPKPGSHRDGRHKR